MCRFLLAVAVTSVYTGHPYSMPGDGEAGYILLEDYGDQDWDVLKDVIRQAKRLCCRQDCRETRAIGDGEPTSKAMWSQNREFTRDYRECLQLIDLQKLAAPLRAILKRQQPVGEMEVAINDHL